MRRLTDTTLPILLAASLFAVSGGAYAGDDCSNSSIEEDDYWTVLDGTAFVLSPLTSLNIPITASGLLKYDGEGGCEFSGTVNIGGAITQVDAADSCTYSVFDDCTGVQTTAISGIDTPLGSVGITATSNFGIVNDAEELPFEISAELDLGLPTGPVPLIATGTAQKIEED